MESIISDKKECYVCRKKNVHKHHIYFGTNRKQSDKIGAWVYLCPEHHVGFTGVHQNKALDLFFKTLCQKKFEENHSREEFVKVIGRNYL